jgi:hypothetical protein
MEFKGTKGKWNYYEQPITGFYIQTIGKHPDDSFIADIGGGLQSKKEVEANALLISKAPEMMEMLKQCVETLEFGGQIGFTYTVAKQLIKEATEI